MSIQLRAAGEVSPKEEGLIELIAPAGAILTITAGVVDAVVADAGKTAVMAYDIVATLGNACIDVGALVYNASFGRALGRVGYDPIPTIQPEEVDRLLERQAAKVWDMNCYHIGRCGGDALLTAVDALAFYKGGAALLGKMKDGAKLMSGGYDLVVLGNGTMGLEKGLSWAADGTVILGTAEEALAGLGWYYAASDFWGSYSKIDWDKGSTGFGWDSGAGELKEIYNSIKESPNYPEGFVPKQNGTKETLFSK